jgi:hypothetical protein
MLTVYLKLVCIVLADTLHPTTVISTKQEGSTSLQGAPLRAAVDRVQAFLDKCDAPLKNSLHEQRAPLDTIATTTTSAAATTAAAAAVSMDVVVPTYRGLDNIELLRTICSVPLCSACSDTQFIIVVDRPEHTAGVKQALADLPNVVVIGNPVRHSCCCRYCMHILYCASLLCVEAPLYTHTRSSVATHADISQIAG